MKNSFAFLLVLSTLSCFTLSMSATSLTLSDVWMPQHDEKFKTWITQNIAPKSGAQIEFIYKQNGLYDIEATCYTSEKEQSIWDEIADKTAVQETAFTPYIKQPETALFKTKHSLLIQSLSGNMLVIPKNHYVTLAGFLKSATTEEKNDLWTLWEASRHALCKQGVVPRMTVHMGSNGAQVVPHLHCRLELDGASIQLPQLINDLQTTYKKALPDC